MSESQSDFAQFAEALRQFAAKRNWEKFHTPKNLAMAVAGEAGELVSEFQWLTSEESNPQALSAEKLEAIGLEIADVQIYLIRLADVLGVSIPDLVRQKIAINEDRF